MNGDICAGPIANATGNLTCCCCAVLDRDLEEPNVRVAAKVDVEVDNDGSQSLTNCETPTPLPDSKPCVNTIGVTGNRDSSTSPVNRFASRLSLINAECSVS